MWYIFDENLCHFMVTFIDEWRLKFPSCMVVKRWGLILQYLDQRLMFVGIYLFISQASSLYNHNLCFHHVCTLTSYRRHLVCTRNIVYERSSCCHVLSLTSLAQVVITLPPPLPTPRPVLLHWYAASRLTRRDQRRKTAFQNKDGFA